ncbi:MAG: hypothetical protein ACPGED_02820, partial [Flavobacteriales bacterium]
MKKVILFCLISFCMATATQAQDKGQLIDEVIGVVGNEILLNSEVEAQMLTYTEQGVAIDE